MQEKILFGKNLLLNWNKPAFFFCNKF
jgi:hypothetical protein